MGPEISTINHTTIIKPNQDSVLKLRGTSSLLSEDGGGIQNKSLPTSEENINEMSS